MTGEGGLVLKAIKRRKKIQLANYRNSDFDKCRRRRSRKRGREGGGKTGKLEWKEKKRQFPGGLESQKDLKECLECENLE